MERMTRVASSPSSQPRWMQWIALAMVLGAGACGTSVPNYITDFPALNENGTVNAVIEIPAGTDAKFEVTPQGGAIEQDLVDGNPRFIEYLAYPWNYGMIPRTLEDPAMGGDGDPLDVIVLGRAIPRGELVAVQLIGVVRMLDTGERDDKLIAVIPETSLAGATDVSELDQMFPGITEILRIWLAHYKGAGLVEIEGIQGAAEARRVLEDAAAAFERIGGR